MIKLVLSDMDNTLLPFGSHQVSDRARAAIAEVRAAGIQFGPATGRDYSELMRFFDGDDSCFSTGLLSNGKKVMVDGDIRRLSLVDNAALQRFADRVASRDDVFVTAYPFETTLANPVYCIGVTQEVAEVWGRRFAFEAHVADRVPDERLIGGTFACSGTQADLDELKAIGTELCPEFDFIQPVPNWVDIVPAGVNKGSSLDVLLDELGISSDEVLFFGDAENDLQIMEKVENSVAVANATPAAAAAARWHIGSSADDSVAAALEDVARSAREGRLPSFMR